MSPAPSDTDLARDLDADIAGNAAFRPTIVLVPGAFTDSGAWATLAQDLEQRGYSAVIAANPLQGVEADSQALMALLKTIDNHMILVGHSYGGMLISNAACASYDVEALVFAGAYAPDKGETLAMLLADLPDATPGEVTIPGEAGDPAWKILPSWFVYGDADECITQEMHARFAARAGAVDTLVVAGATHDLAVTNRDEIIAAIDLAARATSAAVPNVAAD